MQFKDGNTDIGSRWSPCRTGRRSSVTPSPTPENHSISAVFTGGPGFLGSTATAKPVTRPTRRFRCPDHHGIDG
ncbi:hypothetical protein GS531_20605, partial [Rhodococcus hoagii]|nr:hypothetical protein [Prescottella equi]